MRLTQFSNFAIRLLMYAALKGETPSAVSEVARAYEISHDHLKKAAAELCRRGYLDTVRGRNGGFRLAMEPRDIRIGDVIRQTEGETVLVECFDPATNTCPDAHRVSAAGSFAGSSSGVFRCARPIHAGGPDPRA